MANISTRTGRIGAPAFATTTDQHQQQLVVSSELGSKVQHEVQHTTRGEGGASFKGNIVLYIPSLQSKKGRQLIKREGGKREETRLDSPKKSSDFQNFMECWRCYLILVVGYLSSSASKRARECGCVPFEIKLLNRKRKLGE